MQRSLLFLLLFCSSCDFLAKETSDPPEDRVVYKVAHEMPRLYSEDCEQMLTLEEKKECARVAMLAWCMII